MPKSEVLLYSRSKFNATAILYKLAICKGKIYGIVLYEIFYDDVVYLADFFSFLEYDYDQTLINRSLRFGFPLFQKILQSTNK